MALRSLVGMLKALPRRMPGSGAFSLKGNPWSKSNAGLTDPSIVDSVVAKRYPQLYEIIKRHEEEARKKTMADYRNVALFSIVSIGSMGYIASNM